MKNVILKYFLRSLRGYPNILLHFRVSQSQDWDGNRRAYKHRRLELIARAHSEELCKRWWGQPLRNMSRIQKHTQNS